ncbi:hypothetical protein JCM10908_000374 [Rhodotorula pacifica]|uniref:uncharacterized protein n=1 Tax=Rhodotorula pacifica TaxID=1495444 RepID=UPI00317F4EA4
MSDTKRPEAKPDALSALSALFVCSPRKLIHLPVDAHLRGPNNYNSWTTELCGDNARRLLDGLACNNKKM